MLDVQKLEEGQMPLHITRTRVADVAGDVVRQLEGVARERGAPLRLTADAAVEILADTDLVRRAIENLVGNALKFSSPGQEVEVTVRQDLAGASIESELLMPPIQTQARPRPSGPAQPLT